MEPRLGIYIHIPFCASKCGYCDFYSCAGAADRMADYQHALLEHIEESAGRIAPASSSCSTPSRPPAACSSARR